MMKLPILNFNNIYFIQEGIKIVISAKEVNNRHLVIQKALEKDYSPKQIKDAIALWDNAFYQSPLFVSKIPVFIANLSRTLNLSSNEQLRLIKKLIGEYHALNKPKQKITPKKQKKAPSLSPEYIIFNSFLKGVVFYIKQEKTQDLSDLQSILLEELPQIKAKKEVNQQYISWCESITKEKLFIIHHNMNPEYMAEFIDFLYEEFCHLLGAKYTDHLFSNIMKKCNKLPAAQYFSPYKLF